MPWIAIAGAFLGLTSVIMGAAGDHLLKDILNAKTAQTFDIALRYHQLYAILIFCMGLYGAKNAHAKVYTVSCLLFLSGIVIFSGSLYASLWVSLGPLAFGTPMGGMMLMAGWVFAAAAFLVKIRQHP